MKPMPKTAKSVALFIKENVPRPPLPTEVYLGGPLGWKIGNMTRVCPMGLLPCAISSNPSSFDDLIGEYAPSNKQHFTEGDAPGSQKAIGVFYRWWDSLKLEDAKSAVNAIWGEK